jgi:xanthine dehydrogenase/oxidase
VLARSGNSVDLSHAIMDRAILHSDCAFDIPAVRIRGRLCRTNQASNTAFRGFGGPQGMLVANTWMEALAQKLCMAPETLQERNLYGNNAVTHFGQRLPHNRLHACWHGAMQQSDWPARRAAVDEFNRRSKCASRGLLDCSASRHSASEFLLHCAATLACAAPSASRNVCSPRAQAAVHA